MAKYIFGIVLVMMLAITQALSSTFNIFEDHKLKIYSPVKAGVKDILFDVKVKGLEEYVKQTTALTHLDDLYFRVYWAYPSQLKVDVEGLPRGFKVLRSKLKTIVKPYIDLIFSDNFVVQFERIPFIKNKIKKRSYVKKNNELDTTDIEISFDGNGLLLSLDSKTPFSRIKTRFNNVVRSWSKGKYVVDKITVIERTNGLINNKVISITRKLYSGVGMPSKVTLVEKIKNGKKLINEKRRDFTFFNYHINTGKPQKIIKGK